MSQSYACLRSLPIHEHDTVLYYMLDERPFFPSWNVDSGGTASRSPSTSSGTRRFSLWIEERSSSPYDRREYTIEGSWFWPAYPGPYTVFHRAPGCESWSHRHLAFQGPLFSRWLATGLWFTEPQAAPPGRDWAAYFDEMRRLAGTPTRWGRLRAQNMLEGLLLQLAEARQASPGHEPWLERVLNSLDSPDERSTTSKSPCRARDGAQHSPAKIPRSDGKRPSTSTGYSPRWPRRERCSSRPI